MWKNKTFAMGLWSFLLLCFVSFEIHSKSQGIIPNQAVELERVIGDIREEKERFAKSLNDHIRSLDVANKSNQAYNKAVDAYKSKDAYKSVDSYNQILDTYDKAVDAYNKAEDKRNASVDKTKEIYDASQKTLEDFIKAKDAYDQDYDVYNQTYDAYIQAKYAYKKVLKDYMEARGEFDMNLEPSHQSSQKDSHKSKKTFLESLNTSLLTSQKVNESKKELWINLNTLLKVLAQSLETSTRILKVKHQRKSVKECFKIARKIKERSKKYKDTLDIVNNKIDVLNSTIMNTHELLKLTGISPEEEDKIHEAYNQSENKIFEILVKLWKKRERVDKLEETLRQGLLIKVKETFRHAIHFVGKEPRAEGIYQQSLEAYEEIERFYVHF